MSPSLCKQVGHWRISKEVVGSGTTSTVMLATHAKLPALRAAVKVVSRSGLLIKADGDPTALHLADAVIHREVLLMKLAAHQRVVRLYDFVGHGDMVYMVLEYAPNKTLFDLFRASPSYLPPPLVTHIFSQLMQGLTYMHALRIVHRDIKLENIFVFGPDVKTLLRKTTMDDFSALSIKIGDFGLSHMDDPRRLSTVFHGSPHYQAPELWARLPHLALPTDVWAAGIILYALQCRHLPFDLAVLEDCAAAFVPDHSPNQQYIDQTPIPDPGSPRYMAYNVPNLMPAPADRLLQRIFALDPATRPTASEVLDDPYFDGFRIPAEQQDLQDYKSLPMTPRTDLYDIATLCIPPARHLPRESFVGSTLERGVRAHLESRKDVIEKRWAQMLDAYNADKEAQEAAWEAQIFEKEKKTWTKTLGRKRRSADVLGQMEMNLAVLKPKLPASLSFRSFRVKPADSLNLLFNSPLVAPPPSPVSSSVAEALEERHDALLQRAYELGFGTRDLRAFADEAGRIVRVAREGRGGMGLDEIAREIERRSGGRPRAPFIRAVSPLVPHGAACASTATTLVSENGLRGSLEKSNAINVPVVRVVAVDQ